MGLRYRMAEKPPGERAPIRVIEVGAGRRHGPGIDDAPDQLAALGVPRRYCREIDPATAAGMVAAAAHAPHDRLNRGLPARIVLGRCDRQPGSGVACGDHEVAAGEAEQVICSCRVHRGWHERAGVEQRDAAGGGDPQP